MKKLIQAVKGTREFYPYEMALRTWLYQKIRDVSESFGYQEYDGPFLESIDLYAAKSGEELVKEQSFVFPDRGGNLITLRPELTLSLARMVAQRQHELIYPLRWWSFGPFWRYEKPQKGRTREFFQWNIDLVGVDTPDADAELISIAVEFFKSVGLTSKDVKVLVNDRRLMETEIMELGISIEKKAEVFGLIDRHDKMAAEEWNIFAREKDFSEKQINGLREILINKDLFNSSEYLLRFFRMLDALGVSEFVEYDARVVRGLDYYTGIVFEARDVGENARAILGGGRYDNLVGDVGGEPLTGIGFAMGDVVLPILLKELNKLPEIRPQPARVLITVFDETTAPTSYAIATELRKSGINTMVYPEIAKLGKQFKYADRLGLQMALVIGPDEVAEKLVQVKQLKNGDQKSIARKDLVEVISTELARLNSA